MSQKQISIDIEKMENKNLFIDKFNLIGGKSTENSGIFVFNFSKEGYERRVAFIILESLDIKNDTQKLYDWLNDSYFK